MKWFILNIGEILIDEINIPIVQSCTWKLTPAGYVQGSGGKYKGQYLHCIIAKKAGLDMSNEIDHKDMDTRNNQLSNLRPATRPQNMQNRKIRSNNTSGRIGICYNKKIQKYVAHVNRIYLGSFDTIEEASEVRWAAAKKYHKEFARFK